MLLQSSRWLMDDTEVRRLRPSSSVCSAGIPAKFSMRVMRLLLRLIICSDLSCERLLILSMALD